MAVVPPQHPGGTDREFLLTNFHRHGCLVRQSLTVGGRWRQLAFCPYCGIINKNADTAFSRVRKHLDLLFSTADRFQLCYTNRCGVVVVGVVIVVGSVVNFLNFDLTIGCLPLIWIVWIKECLFWRFQENPCIIDKVISQNVHLLDYIQLLVIGWAGQWTRTPSTTPLQPKKWNAHFWITFNFWWSAGLVDGLEPHLPSLPSQKNKMLIFGLRSTSDDRPGNLSKKRWPKSKKWKRPPKSLKNQMFIFGFCSTSDDWPRDPSKKHWPKHKKTKKAPYVIEKWNVRFWITFNFWWSAERSEQKMLTKMQKNEKGPLSHQK